MYIHEYATGRNLIEIPRRWLHYWLKWASNQDTASGDIQDLIEKGILAKDKAGGISNNYLLRKQTRSIHTSMRVNTA